MKYRVSTYDFDPLAGAQQHTVIQGFADTPDEALDAAGGFLKTHKAVVIEKVELNIDEKDRKTLEALT